MDLTVIEAELAALADELAAVLPDECLACYLDRQIPQFGCRGHALTERWNSERERPIRGLLDKLRSRGGYCDCEVVFNVLLGRLTPIRDRRLRCPDAFPDVE